MTSTFETVGDVLIVSLAGKLNSGNAPEVEADILRRAGQDASHLLLDLSALDYISSAGLRVVLVAAKRVKQSAGKMMLCGLQTQIREVFEISGFLNILQVVSTREQALQNLSREG